MRRDGGIESSDADDRRGVLSGRPSRQAREAAEDTRLVIDDPTPTSASEPELLQPPADAAPRGARRSSADVAARRPAYKGAELDAARGPGLGCFWFQATVLAIFLVLIPVGVHLNWPFELLAALLFIVLGLLLFVGQTMIFLLRLVAADRRDVGRRRPLASATPTVGEMEDALPSAAGAEDTRTPDGPAPAPEPADAPDPDAPALEPGSEGVRE
jgi:hypothetical protein